MATQLSAYRWLRNSEFRNMLGHPSSRLKKDARPKLMSVLEELDRLHEASDMVGDDRKIYGPNVAVTITRRVLERSSDRKRSKELFLEIHRVLRDSFVDPMVYVRLQRAHDEINIAPEDEDFKRALQYGVELEQKRRNWAASTGRHSGSGLKDYFCWDVEIKRNPPSFYG